LSFDQGEGFAVEQIVTANTSQFAVPFFQVTHFFLSIKDWPDLPILELKICDKPEGTCVFVDRDSFCNSHRDRFAIFLALYMANDHLSSLYGGYSTVGVINLSRNLHEFVAAVKELADISSIVFCKHKFTPRVLAWEQRDI